jgi:cell fate regulator YaaT (PSP1 superfamily)
MIYYVEITPFRVELIRAGSGPPCRVNDRIIFRSKEGTDVGRVVRIQEEDEPGSYGEMVRPATPEDLAKREQLTDYTAACREEFKKAIREFNLDIKPVYTHCQLDEERIIFYFTAEKKVEFRRLHRNISQKLNRRVVIKQIGSRDFARIFGGVGPCGRNLCCGTFLADLKSISLRMAREQKLYVSPGKLSGICGKLLCCLNFEEDFYTDFQNKEKDAEEKSDTIEKDLS